MMNTVELINFETKLREYSGEDRIVQADELLREVKAEGRRRGGVPTGLKSLDKTLGGFYSGQLIVVSGTTGHGKTTLCQTFTYTLVAQNIKPLWFSYELDSEDFLEQFDEMALPRFYLPKKLTGRTTEWLDQRIWEAKLKYGVGAVFIDHLHYLVDLAKTHNISFDVGAVVRNLKRLAVRHNLIIFLIAHTSKTKPDAELGLGDTRDSSFIEQEADTVLYVWRLKTKNESVVKVAKNRKKGIIDEKVTLTFRGGRLYDESKPT